MWLVAACQELSKSTFIFQLGLVGGLLWTGGCRRWRGLRHLRRRAAGHANSDPKPDAERNVLAYLGREVYPWHAPMACDMGGG